MTNLLNNLSLKEDKDAFFIAEKIKDKKKQREFILKYQDKKKDILYSFLFLFTLGYVGGHRFYLKRYKTAISMYILPMLLNIVPILGTFIYLLFIFIFFLIDIFKTGKMAKKNNEKIANDIFQELINERIANDIFKDTGNDADNIDV